LYRFTSQLLSAEKFYFYLILFSVISAILQRSCQSSFMEGNVSPSNPAQKFCLLFPRYLFQISSLVAFHSAVFCGFPHLFQAEIRVLFLFTFFPFLLLNKLGSPLINYFIPTNALHYFSVYLYTYVSALLVPSSEVSSRVHNFQCIQFTFTTYNSLSLNITYLLVHDGQLVFLNWTH
jgi:hypothetical protein